MAELFFLDKKPSLWTRFLARGVDYGLFYMVFSLLSMVLPFYVEDFFYLGFAVFVPVFWAFLEALLISRTKTTPGKSLFGIRVETHVGGKLPFWISLKRALCLGRRPGEIKQKKVGKTRFITGILVFCALLGGSYFEKDLAVPASAGLGTYKVADGWKEYTPSNGKFTVIFPEKPSHEEGVLQLPAQEQGVNYDEFKSYQTKKVYYSVSYIEIPKRLKIAGSNRILHGALDLIVKHTPGATVVSENSTKHKNLKALDFHISQGEEEVQGRLILDGTTLFRLTAVYPPALAGQLQHEDFINSFEVHG